MRKSHVHALHVWFCWWFVLKVENCFFLGGGVVGVLLESDILCSIIWFHGSCSRLLWFGIGLTSIQNQDFIYFAFWQVYNLPVTVLLGYKMTIQANFNWDLRGGAGLGIFQVDIVIVTYVKCTMDVSCMALEGLGWRKIWLLNCCVYTLQYIPFSLHHWVFAYALLLSSFSYYVCQIKSWFLLKLSLLLSVGFCHFVLAGFSGVLSFIAYSYQVRTVFSSGWSLTYALSYLTRLHYKIFSDLSSST